MEHKYKKTIVSKWEKILRDKKYLIVKNKNYVKAYTKDTTVYISILDTYEILLLIVCPPYETRITRTLDDTEDIMLLLDAMKNHRKLPLCLHIEAAKNLVNGLLATPKNGTPEKI